MKSKDLQNVVFSKYRNGNRPTKIFHDLAGGLSLETIKGWCKMIDTSGSVDLAYSSGRSRIVRTSGEIKKVKARTDAKGRVTVRKLARELHISLTSIHKILKEDPKYCSYKKIVQPFLIGAHKAERKAFANWIHTNLRKEQTIRIIFSDEKVFDNDGLFNLQNDRVWGSSRSEASERDGIVEKRKFPQKVMMWLGACSKGISPLVIFEEGTVDHARYIKKMISVALKYGNKVFSNDWTFQQDGATAHIHQLTQEWCQDHLPSFIDKNCCPSNGSELNPLDYSIWDELAEAMDWNKMTSKRTLIDELKKAPKKVRANVVFESCNPWTTRLSKVSKLGGNHLSK